MSMFTAVRRAVNEQNENFRKEIKNIRHYHTEIIQLNNTIAEKLSRKFTSRLELKERISKLKHRAVEFI